MRIPESLPSGTRVWMRCAGISAQGLGPWSAAPLEPAGALAGQRLPGRGRLAHTYKKLTGGNSHNYLRDFQPTPDGGFVGAGFLFAL
jgi:hypothetical protein